MSEQESTLSKTAPQAATYDAANDTTGIVPEGGPGVVIEIAPRGVVADDVPDLFAPTDAFDTITVAYASVGEDGIQGTKTYTLTKPSEWTARQFTSAAAIIARAMGSAGYLVGIDGEFNPLGLIHAGSGIASLLQEGNLIDDLLATVYVEKGDRFDRQYPVEFHAEILSGAPGQAIGAAVRSFFPYLRKYTADFQTSLQRMMATVEDQPEQT